jgi:hypothetical protein
MREWSGQTTSGLRGLGPTPKRYTTDSPLAMRRTPQVIPPCAPKRPQYFGQNRHKFSSIPGDQ